MAVTFLTMAPTAGDGAYPGSNQVQTANWSDATLREPTLPYLLQIAHTAEQGGFDTLLLAVGGGYLDGWVGASFLAAHTTTLRFLIALRPGFVAPTVAARQAATFDYLSGGRLSLNVVTGGSPVEQAKDGDFLPHDERYRRTREYVQLVKRYFQEEHIDHAGEFFRVADATLSPKPVQRPHPPFFMAGDSEPGQALAAEEADVYMTWGGPIQEMRSKLRAMQARVAAGGRSSGYAISFQVILGATEEAAWARAEAMLERMTTSAIARQQAYFRTMDSVGQQRLQGYMERSARDNFRLGPHLWAGLTQVLGGNSIALVGTPAQVADEIVAYVRLGFDHVLLRGFPYLETIAELGRDVLPLVRARLGNS